jgi:hypothetical protein
MPTDQQAENKRTTVTSVVTSQPALPPLPAENPGLADLTISVGRGFIYLEGMTGMTTTTLTSRRRATTRPGVNYAIEIFLRSA